jgi:hypothetical protein
MYEVGDIVYIISNKQRQVIPAKIVEQVTRRTLSGEQISYKIQLPGDPNQTRTVDLSSVDGSVHTSIEEVRDLLYKHAMGAIDSVLEAASSMRDSSFGPEKIADVSLQSAGQRDNVQQVEVPKSKKNGASKLKIQFPDGSSANVNMPDVQ